MLLVADIPDAPAELSQWLERQLVGLQLRELIVELRAFSEAPSRSETADIGNLDAVLGGRLPQVLEEGLKAAAPAQLRSLLARPAVLLELQERILTDGGDYWRTVPRTAEHQAAVQRNRRTLSSALAATAGSPEQAAVQPSTTIAAEPPARSRRRWAYGVAAALAAMLLVAFFLNRPGTGPTWGFDRPGALAAAMPPKDYLNHLADAADDWFKKRPATRDALDKRLREFRHGCDTLLAAPHPQLADADRQWLYERCRVWRGKIDQHLTTLAAGDARLEAVQEEADQTIRQLINALRQRAETVDA